MCVCAHSSAVSVKMTWHNQIPLHLCLSSLPCLSQPLLSVKIWTKCFECCSKSLRCLLSPSVENGEQSALLSGSFLSCLLHAWMNQQTHGALHYSKYKQQPAQHNIHQAAGNLLRNKRGAGGAEVFIQIYFSLWWRCFEYLSDLIYANRINDILETPSDITAS